METSMTFAMMRPALLGALVLAAAASLGLAAPAAAMTVQPVVIDLKPAGHAGSAAITVENTFTTPLPVELTVQSLAFDETGVKPTGKDPGDILVFPPQAIIAPGQTQTFRVQWVGDPTLARSQHYFVTVAQLPVKLPEGQSAIQILYDFQVLVSVAASQGEPHLTVTAASVSKVAGAKPTDPVKYEPLVTVKNRGPNYGYLSHSRMTVSERNGAGKEVFKRVLSPEEIQQTLGFGLIGPEVSRTLTIPVELPQPQGTVAVELSNAGGR
jgi:fimbrial chaperone protein